MESCTLFVYSWQHKDNLDKQMVIHCYGVTKDGHDVLVHVNGFAPYVYIELSCEWPVTSTNLQMVYSGLKNEFKYVKDVKFKRKRRLFYNHNTYDTATEKWTDKMFPFFCVTFSKKFMAYKFEKEVANKTFKWLGPKIPPFAIKVHENNASPVLQYVSNYDLPTAGWIRVNGYAVADKISTCKREYKAMYNQIKAVSDETVPAIRIMSFDIEANSTNENRMPDADVDGDKIFQISCVIGMSSDPQPQHSILITLGKANADVLDKAVRVIECANEGDLLIQYKNIVREYNPQLVIGYNIFSFDLPYMIARAKRSNVMIDFCMHGLTDEVAAEREIRWSSSAYKNQNFKYLDAPGRLYVDMLPMIQRDYKLDNYRLKTVAAHFIGDTKDPLTAKDIFRCYRLGTAPQTPGTREDLVARSAISIVGKYCIQDSALVFRLFSSLQSWVGLVQMAVVTNVPIFALYVNGQQIKVFSQIYKECIKKNYVVEKDGYVASETDKLMGAIVLDPVPGVYERIVPFDFTSLYPTTIIAYNLCFSTLVKDDDPIDDRYCHVIQCDEHRSCIAGDMLVTLTHGESMQIRYMWSIYDTPSLDILTVKECNDPDAIKIIQSVRPKEWLNKSQRLCIKLTLDDSVTLTCTPDHRILAQGDKWVEAGDLKNGDLVSCMFTYPECRYSELVSHFEVNPDIPMNSLENVKQAVAIVRLLGYLRISTFMIGCPAPTFCSFRVETDAQAFVRDISVAYNISIKYTLVEDLFVVILPLHIHHDRLCDDYGYDHFLPQFVLDSKCPAVIKREFLAALFGSDANVPQFSNLFQMFTRVGLTSINSFKSLMFIQKLLREFDVDSVISVSNILVVRNQSIPTFYAKIGYRYNSLNQMRVFVASLYTQDCARAIREYYSLPWYRRLLKWWTFSLDFATFARKRQASCYFGDAVPSVCTPILTRVTCIEDAGMADVYDLSVPDALTFTASGVIVHNCEHDTVKRATKDVICQQKTYRFLKEPKGIVPQLLEELLAARVRTRKQQKEIKKHIKDDPAQQLLYDVLEKRQLSLKVSANSVYGAFGTRKGYLPFLPGAQCTTALGRTNIQRAAKYIKMNYSAQIVYGDSVTGDTPILVRKIQNTAEIDLVEIQKFGSNWVDFPEFKDGELGLSCKEYAVPEPCEVWTLSGWRRVVRVVRHKTAKDIYRVQTGISSIDVTEDHSLIDGQHALVKPAEVTPSTVLKECWPTDLLGFDMFGPCQPYAFLLGFVMGTGMYRFTYMMYDNKVELELTVPELGPGFRAAVPADAYSYDSATGLLTIHGTESVISILSGRFPQTMLNASVASKMSFLDGFRCAQGSTAHVYTCRTPLAAQFVYCLLKTTSTVVESCSVYVHTDTNNEYVVSTTSVTATTTTTVKLLGPCDGYVYDIETVDGTFHAGIGELIVKNTDSVYVHFPSKMNDSYEQLWTFCEQVEQEVNSLFLQPMHLSFEEAIYSRFFILTKKRYVCLKSDKFGNISDKLMIRGLLLARRDNADIIRDIYRKTIYSIFYNEPVETILDTILDHITKMFTFQHSLKSYVITKSVGDVKDYKVRSLPDDVKQRAKRLTELQCTEDTYSAKALPANAQLAEKMRRRGSIVTAGQRLEFVTTNPRAHDARQFDKIEDVDYFRAHSDILRIDPLYYLKLMSKPLDEVLKVGANVDQFVVQQYKQRLQYHKVMAQLRTYFRPRYVLAE